MSLLSFLQHGQLYARLLAPLHDFILTCLRFFLSFCWLTGSGGFGPHAMFPGLGGNRGASVGGWRLGDKYWTELKLFIPLVIIFLSRKLY